MASSYSPEVKAQVIADYALGMSKSAIAKKHSLGRSTVIAWLQDSMAPVPTLSDTQKRDELGSLVYEYLATGLRALVAQAREVGEPEYIKAQSADALYLLHGTLADKLIAIFGAIERGRTSSTSPEAEAAAEFQGWQP